MKKIALSALLVLSSAAFAAGQNAPGPQNPPPPPPPPPQEQVSRICGDFYEWAYPGLNYEEANLPGKQTIATVGFNTLGLVGANAFCVLMGLPAAMEQLCRTARANGYSCVTGHEWQYTRPDVP